MKDYAGWYERISAPFRGEAARKLLGYADKALVALFAIGYVVTLGILAFTRDAHALRFVLVPATVFVIVTVARLAIDEPRPYEMFDIDALVRKDTHGKSMPSRHMASAVAIAFAFAWLNMGLGIAAFACCAAVAFTRIVGGVHFPRDIVAATAVAAAIGAVGFFVIP